MAGTIAGLNKGENKYFHARDKSEVVHDVTLQPRVRERRQPIEDTHKSCV